MVPRLGFKMYDGSNGCESSSSSCAIMWTCMSVRVKKELSSCHFVMLLDLDIRLYVKV